MPASAVVTKLGALKTVWGAGLFAAALISALASIARVPAKLSAHVAQSDTLIHEQARTNDRLDVLICLQAKLDTPVGCVAKQRR